jgi:hypothetical protein
MSGEQTHGYDLVWEWAEQAYAGLLSAFFDDNGFLLDQILGALNIQLPAGSPFSVTVAFDKPGGLPAAATDVVDIHVLLGEGGSLGALRIVASVDVDTLQEFDLVRINLEQKLWLTEISVVGFPIPGLNTLFANSLRQNVKLIPLVPFKVDRTTTNNIQFKSADVHIIDDTSPADKDGSALLVTFGGGSPGDKSAFTQHFIPPDGNSAILASVAWVCRVISPLIDQALNLDGAFTDCHLTRTVRIDEERDVDLTELSITASDDGTLHVVVKIKKSGFCYSATGTVGAKIKLGEFGGDIVVDIDVDNPTIDVDIPWYCWVAGAVIGALLGFVLHGVILAIVGAVLVPLITYIAEQIIEGIVNTVAERIATALNEISAPIDLPAVGFELFIKDAHIDDIQIACEVRPIDTAIVRATGTVVVPTGAAFDLDSGRVGKRDMPSGDLAVTGGLLERTVQAVCGARWSRTGLRDFNALYRSALYGYAYAAPNPIGLDDLATLDPFGFVFGDPFKESRRIYGVRTNEGRWAAVQAVEVTFEHIRFRYITWEKALATVEIVGDFPCPVGKFVNFGELAKPGTAVFVPSPALGTRAVDITTGATITATTTGAQPDPCVQFRDAVRAVAPATTADKGVDPVLEAICALPPTQRRIGNFVASVVRPRSTQARFDAKTNGFGAGQQAKWQLNGTGLGGPSGQVDLGGGSTAKYELVGTSVILSLNANTAVEMLLSVTVVDDAAHVASAERCVHYDPRCPGGGRVTPVWTDYQTAFLTNFGVAEVPTPAPVIL